MTPDQAMTALYLALEAIGIDTADVTIEMPRGDLRRLQDALGRMKTRHMKVMGFTFRECRKPMRSAEPKISARFGAG